MSLMATKKEREENLEKRLVELTRVKLTGYIPHSPTVKQQAFLWLTCLEALFGGAAGGGKSDALLMAALQYVDVPGYAAILFRKTYPELKMAHSLVPRADEWLRQTDAKWNENDKQWTFPSGATLSFGYMKNDDDRHRYQSAEYQFLGFDELTSFTRPQYTYMLSRLRRASICGNKTKGKTHYELIEEDKLEPLWKGSTAHCPICKKPAPPLWYVPLRVRAATNPGGRGHVWVKERFLDRTDNPPDDYTERIFIPSRLKDNPHVDKESYERSLEELDPGSRAQLLEGSWDVREDEEWVIPDHTWIEAAVALGEEVWNIGPSLPPKGKRGERAPYRFGIDWGERTASYIIWPLPHGGIFVPPSEVIGEHEDPVAVGERMLAKAEKLNIPVRRACYDAAGVQSMRSFLATAKKRPGWKDLYSTKIPFNKYKKETIQYERLLFRRTARGEGQGIIAIHPDNEKLIHELRLWKFKKVADRPTDDVEKIDDHSPDALLAGIAPTAARHRALKIKQQEKEGQRG